MHDPTEQETDEALAAFSLFLASLHRKHPIAIIRAMDAFQPDIAQLRTECINRITDEQRQEFWTA